MEWWRLRYFTQPLHNQPDPRSPEPRNTRKRSGYAKCTLFCLTCA